MSTLGPGDEIGGFRIESLAGRGGMGLVYRALQRRPERIVAIKVIAPELAADPSFRARFEQESSIAAEIEHPNVIPVYAVGDDRGLLFIAMRFVQGTDLRAMLSRSGRLAPDRAARLIAQAADALDAAHHRGLVHRDVKPANILVDASDHVYLTDFGLTKRSADSGGMTQPGMFVGTVDYIAPEQVEGKRVDARTDIYALACVLYELLSGTVPFPRDSDVAKIIAHVNEAPPSLIGVPAPLAAAVSRAMAKRPEDRFMSAGDFGRAVVAGASGRVGSGDDRTVAQGAAAPAAPPPAAPSARPPSPPNSRRGVTSAALLAVLAAAIVVAVVAILTHKTGGGGSTSATTVVSTPSTTQSTSSTTSSSATSSSTSSATTAVASPTPAPQATQSRIFSAQTPSGTLTLHGSTTHGTCPGGSELVGRSDAWRCFVGNDIFDPCFEVGADEVACPTVGPWSARGVIVDVQGGLDQTLADPNKQQKGTPWALQLTSGARCRLFGGATNAIDGKRLNYGCTGGIGLYGDVIRSGRPWTIFGGGKNSSQITPRGVAIVWY